MPLDARPRPPQTPPRHQPRAADEAATTPPTAPLPSARSAAPAPAGARAPDRLDGQLAAAVMQRAVLARRTSSPHANVLEFDSTAEAREKMGLQAFAQFQRWLLNDADLAPILRIDPAPVRQFLVTSLMNRFAGSDIPYIKNVLNRLAKPPLSVEQVVMLTPPRADFLLSYAANPKALKIAHEELESLKQLSPLPKTPLTAGELADAANEVAAAKLTLQALAPYNYDRALRAKAELRGDAAADKTYAADVAGAATIKKAALKDADDEVERATKKLMEGEVLPAKKPTPTSRQRVKTWLTKEAKVKGEIAAKLKQAQDDADTAERDAIDAAASRKPASRAAALKAIEDFIGRATTTTSEEDAGWIGETSGLCLPLAESMLGVFVALKDPAKARVAAAWLAATYPEAKGDVATGCALITDLVSGGIEPPLAIKVAELLLPVTLGPVGRSKLAALIAATPTDWVDICAFVTTHYSKAGDQAAKTLELASTLQLPNSVLSMFGRQAHVIVDFKQNHPTYDLVGKTAWLLDVLGTGRHKIGVLCELAWETRALPDDKARLLVVDCAEDLLALRAGDATKYDQVLTAARGIAIDKLEDELKWYRVWLVDHGQAFASSAVLVAGIPTVSERIELIEALKVPQLTAPLLAARAVGGARWNTVADIVKTRATDLTLRLALAGALTAITTHFAAAADELIALLKTNPFENVRRATDHANAVGAPKAYIIWQLEQYTGVDANVYFLAHVNAWHEYLSASGASLATAMTVNADKQKFIAGSTTDVLHVFTVTFTLAGTGGTVSAELHNHVDLPTRRQTSLHYKNFAQKGRELKRGDNRLSRECKQAVTATPDDCVINNVNQFPSGYTL